MALKVPVGDKRSTGSVSIFSTWENKSVATTTRRRNVGEMFAAGTQFWLAAHAVTLP